jgi:hypothetical protein
MCVATTICPFHGVFYDDPSPDAGDGVIDLSDVIAPHPLQEWAPAENPYNARHLLKPDGRDLWSLWTGHGVLRRSETPALYLYRAGWIDQDGARAQGAGVIGVSDALQTNWDEQLMPSVLSLQNPEFSELLVPEGVPLARAGTANGEHYRIWAITQAGVIKTIQEVAAPALASDGNSGLIAVTADAATPPMGLVFSHISQ